MAKKIKTLRVDLEENREIVEYANKQTEGMVSRAIRQLVKKGLTATSNEEITAEEKEVLKVSRQITNREDKQRWIKDGISYAKKQNAERGRSILK